ncbi:MAG: hypothetical protein M0R17_03415 [Candidatus Omnitrophica bacterium]|jgi:hypothetical protein|nr:hypothetical protein [Candidatus Omnitrophota bacterium]
MIKATILATTIYLTPTMHSGGDFGIFGFKYTQKITNAIYFKIRTSMQPETNKNLDTQLKVYMDFDF